MCGARTCVDAEREEEGIRVELEEEDLQVDLDEEVEDPGVVLVSPEGRQLGGNQPCVDGG